MELSSDVLYGVGDSIVYFGGIAATIAATDLFNMLIFPTLILVYTLARHFDNGPPLPWDKTGWKEYTAD